MKRRKAGSILVGFLVFTATFMVFVSEAPAPGAPNMTIVKSCTDASGPEEPINFEAVITNTGSQGLIIDTCTDDPSAIIDNSFPSAEIAIGGTVTITGRYVPTENPSTDVLTCTGHGAITGTVTVSSNPAECSSPTGGGSCRVTGGGKITSGVEPAGGWDGTLAEGKYRNGPGGVDWYTFGGQAGANTALPPQPQGNWTHHQVRGPSGSFVFHGNVIELIECSDPGPCDPAAANGEFKQIHFAGLGVINNAKGILFEPKEIHWFDVHIEDLGEPGNKPRGADLRELNCLPGGNESNIPAPCGCSDYYRIRIYADDTPTTVVYEVSGYLSGGNFQIHQPTGFDMK
jgi:hypothetical protein